MRPPTGTPARSQPYQHAVPTHRTIARTQADQDLLHSQLVEVMYQELIPFPIGAAGTQPVHGIDGLPGLLDTPIARMCVSAGYTPPPAEHLEACRAMTLVLRGIQNRPLRFHQNQPPGPITSEMISMSTLHFSAYRPGAFIMPMVPLPRETRVMKYHDQQTLIPMTNAHNIHYSRRAEARETPPEAPIAQSSPRRAPAAEPPALTVPHQATSVQSVCANEEIAAHTEPSQPASVPPPPKAMDTHAMSIVRLPTQATAPHATTQAQIEQETAEKAHAPLAKTATSSSHCAPVKEPMSENQRLSDTDANPEKDLPPTRPWARLKTTLQHTKRKEPQPPRTRGLGISRLRAERRERRVHASSVALNTHQATLRPLEHGFPNKDPCPRFVEFSTRVGLRRRAGRHQTTKQRKNNRTHTRTGAAR